MKRFPTIDHRCEREQHRWFLDPGEEAGELIECALGERRRDRRHDQEVGGAEHALAGECDARRTVEYCNVIPICEWFEQVAQPSSGSLRIVELEVEVTK